MKNETPKTEDEPKAKVWRRLYEQSEPPKPVCNCPFGCLNWDSHFTINGGRSVFPENL